MAIPFDKFRKDVFHNSENLELIIALLINFHRENVIKLCFTTYKTMQTYKYFYKD